MTTMTYAPPQAAGFGSHGYGQDFGLPMQAPGGAALLGGVTPLHAAGQAHGTGQQYGIPQYPGIGTQFGQGVPFGPPTTTPWLPQFLPQPQQYVPQQAPFGPVSLPISPWQALAAVVAYLQQVLQAGPYGQGQQFMPYGQGQPQFARPMQWPY